MLSNSDDETTSQYFQINNRAAKSNEQRPLSKEEFLLLVEDSKVEWDRLPSSVKPRLNANYFHNHNLLCYILIL